MIAVPATTAPTNRNRKPKKEPMPIAAIAKVINKIPAAMRMDLSLELIFLVKSRSDRFMFNFRVNVSVVQAGKCLKADFTELR